MVIRQYLPTYRFEKEGWVDSDESTSPLVGGLMTVGMAK
jgi:hypothetical protein